MSDYLLQWKQGGLGLTINKELGNLSVMSIETHDGEAWRLNTWNYQEVLADLKTRYDDPIQALGFQDATQLVNAAKILEPTSDDYEARDRFLDMLDGMREDYEGDGTVMYNPDNPEEEFIWSEDDWQLDEKYLE